MSPPHGVHGCFYLDACVILADILQESRYQKRIDKLKKDVHKYNITCYVSNSVEEECKTKIEKTVDFIDNVLRKTIIIFLEKGPYQQRELDKCKISNEDLHLLNDAFLTLMKSQSSKKGQSPLMDPIRAIEEYVVIKMEEEIEKNSQITLSEFIKRITALILKETTRIKSEFQRLILFEGDYITRSDQKEDPLVTAKLVQSAKIHYDDAVHISIVASHKKEKGEAVFLTFDYHSILSKHNEIRKICDVVCCDPIYGLSYLR
ncbi:MAG: hypothetical protein QXL77_01105 [Candidatus Bathyarchaeia archaeon]